MYVTAIAIAGLPASCYDNSTERQVPISSLLCTFQLHAPFRRTKSADMIVMTEVC